MIQDNFEVLADEVLGTFAEIATCAEEKLAATGSVSRFNLASGNTFTGGQAYQNLGDISQINREALDALRREPSIARLVLEDESGERRVVYIARKSSVPLRTGKQLAAYGSPIGRLAELPVGDERNVRLPDGDQIFTLIEKIILSPRLADRIWDSVGNQYRHIDGDIFSIESLRALLQAQEIDISDELDRMLEEDAAASHVQQGISHQIRTAMGLRDQPILDQFQGEIFRLPLDSQLIILGPPAPARLPP